MAPDAHAPRFAQMPYAPFSRSDAVAIALDEWRLWGMRVDDTGGAGYVQTRCHAWASASPAYGSAWANIGGKG